MAEPGLIDLVQELRRTVGLFDGAMAITPKQAWEEAIDVVQRLAARERLLWEFVVDTFGYEESQILVASFHAAHSGGPGTPTWAAECKEFGCHDATER